MQIAGHWFDRKSINDDVTLIYEPHVVPLLRCNIWHIRGRGRDLMVDTGMGVVSLKAFARDLLDKPVSAVATHTHLDHIGNHHEFDECIVHASEAGGLRRPTGDSSLAGPEFDPFDIATLRVPPIKDYEIAGPMLTALPEPSYNMRDWELLPAKVTRIVDEGDVIDTGDRAFEVLHLPGHSPGGIGLWEARTGTLFSGDAIYDGGLLDTLHHSNIADYQRTMRRLRQRRPRRPRAKLWP